MKTLFISTALVLMALLAAAQQAALLPAPQRLQWTPDYLPLDRGQWQVRASDPAAEVIADSLRNWLGQHVGPTPGSLRRTALLEVLLEKDISQINNNPEGYVLEVNGEGLRLRAVAEAGLYYGFRTIQQLFLPEKKGLPGCFIIDFPAFRVRGFMHDTGRSYISPDTLKEHIDRLSRYKINVFHWHLTEDLAWRLESKVFPRLNAPAITLRQPGRFYTQAQARELVAYAAARHVQVIPELDLPGHSGAFRRATGFGMQSPQGKALTKRLLQEFLEVFSGVPLMHIGTDEVNITDTSLVAGMVHTVRAHGSQPMGWWPGSELGPGGIRQLWMGHARPAPGVPTVDSRDLYLNHFDVFGDLISVFQRTLCDTTTGSATRLGAIACIWNDRNPGTTAALQRSNGFYPLMLTFAERAWRGGGQPLTEAGVVITDTAAFSAFEDRLLAQRRHFTKEEFPYVRQGRRQWYLLGPFANGGDAEAIFPPETGNLDFPARPAVGNTIYLRHHWGPGVVRACLPEAAENSTVYAYTRLYAPEARTVQAWVGFQNMGRSELDAAPPAGRWDDHGSRLWLNGQEIQPPRWQTPGRKPTSPEQPYTNEHYLLRPPLVLSLRKGENLLLVKAPIARFSSPAYRLTKWMFTFALAE